MILVLPSCSSGGENKSDQSEEPPVVVNDDPYANWEQYHGVGPVQAFTLPDEVDAQLAAQGQETFESMCSACHKLDKKFIGPAMQDVLTRRNPAWVMNMILAPDKMVQEDPIARKLLVDYNGSPMANQNLTEEQARAVLEYFRTL